MNEDNVYEETTPAESTIAVSNVGEGRNDAEKKDCSIPGKFKDVDALARAYEALQAEFTRRSQRLKELERKTENSAENGAAYTGAEKLRKNALARKKEAKRFDEFLATTEEIGSGESKTAMAEPIEERPLEDAAVNRQNMENEGAVYASSVAADSVKEGLEDGKETEEKEGMAQSVAMGEGVTLSSEELYKQVCGDEALRLRIIGEYLASIGKVGAPLMVGGTGAMVTPPQRAKNIVSAGDMALQYFKQQKIKE